MATKAELFQVDPNAAHTGLLFAVWLDPALASALALPGGEPAEQLHLTLCYCTDANEMTDVQIGRAINAAAEAGMMFGPLTGSINGLLRFNASESSDDLDVFAAQVDVPGLEDLRQYLASMLDFADCPPSQGHGYTPHVTLAYIDPGAALPMQRLETQPFTIRSIWVGVGDRRTEIPLTGGSYKAGARHSRGDQKMLQTMHDHAVSLGANCAPVKAAAAESDNALKAVAKTDTELRVANYMVLFGGRDLEGLASKRRNPDGSRGEYFTKSTKFESAYTDVGTLYVDWEHGAAPAGEPRKDDVLGYVDWKTARIDEKGIFVERVLNRRNKYVRFLEDLISDGLLGNSTEAVPEGVQMAKNGEIKSWPLRRDTLTVQPMESRMITANSLAALKALSAANPALKSIVSAIEAERNSQAERLADPEASRGTASKTVTGADEAALLLELELQLFEIGSLT
jgi:2'-5' RNA ligase